MPGRGAGEGIPCRGSKGVSPFPLRHQPQQPRPILLADRGTALNRACRAATHCAHQHPTVLSPSRKSERGTRQRGRGSATNPSTLHLDLPYPLPMTTARLHALEIPHRIGHAHTPNSINPQSIPNALRESDLTRPNENFSISQSNNQTSGFPQPLSPNPQPPR